MRFNDLKCKGMVRRSRLSFGIVFQLCFGLTLTGPLCAQDQRLSTKRADSIAAENFCSQSQFQTEDVYRFQDALFKILDSDSPQNLIENSLLLLAKRVQDVSALSRYVSSCGGVDLRVDERVFLQKLSDILTKSAVLSVPLMKDFLEKNPNPKVLLQREKQAEREAVERAVAAKRACRDAAYNACMKREPDVYGTYNQQCNNTSTHYMVRRDNRIEMPACYSVPNYGDCVGACYRRGDASSFCQNEASFVCG